MMNRARRRVMGLIAISAVFSFGVMVAQGCGSDSFTASPSTDGGNDAASTGNDGAPQDAGTAVFDGCVKPPNVAANEQEFCNAFAEVTSRCNDCNDECRQQNANTCDTFGSALSDALKNGFVACKDQVECSEFESQANLPSNPCVAAWIADAGPTAAQMATKQAYCDNCPVVDGGIDYCAFYFGTADAGGIGAVTLLSSDTVAAAIAKNCKGCDPTSYVLVCSLGFEFCPASGGKNKCSGSGLCQ